ncbi:hypothetical protein [Vibrio sp. WXL103]|uniref:hypothetical protein n=1 Tax=Vibrio sp. WXL103 TaxID=3450710 RepID=UPI003EC72B0D
MAKERFLSVSIVTVVFLVACGGGGSSSSSREAGGKGKLYSSVEYTGQFDEPVLAIRTSKNGYSQFDYTPTAHEGDKVFYGSVYQTLSAGAVDVRFFQDDNGLMTYYQGTLTFDPAASVGAFNVKIDELGLDDSGTLMSMEFGGSSVPMAVLQDSNFDFTYSASDNTLNFISRAGCDVTLELNHSGFGDGLPYDGKVIDSNCAFSPTNGAFVSIIDFSEDIQYVSIDGHQDDQVIELFTNNEGTGDGTEVPTPNPNTKQCSDFKYYYYEAEATEDSDDEDKDGLQWEAAVDYCASRSARLPTLAEFESVAPGALSSSAETCGWPAEIYWTSHSDGITAWGHHSGINIGSTVFLKTHYMAVLCI